MIPCRVYEPRIKGLWALRLALLAVAAGLGASRLPAESPAAAQTERLPAALTKPLPENLDDLRAIQKQVSRVLARAMPATVGLRLVSADRTRVVAGSGVIVSEDGYVLTAGHVAGWPDREVMVILPDGKRVKGKTLGINRTVDSGLIKITAEGKWPFCAMGDSSELKKGEWCLAIGHPGGYRPGRSPVVRLGRVLPPQDGFVRTDCSLVGGDSGGPLFDLRGRVIGIHSRIGRELTENRHVPVDTYRDTWDRLVKGEAWGGGLAYLGIEFDATDEGCRVVKVFPRSPAARAGLKEDDVLTKFAGQKITDSEDLVNQLQQHKPEDWVVVEVLREKQVVTLKVRLGKRKE